MNFKEYSNPWSAENSPWFGEDNNNWFENVFEVSAWSLNDWNNDSSFDNEDNSKMTPACKEKLGGNSLIDLENLTIKSYINETYKGNSNNLKNKIKERNKHLEELINLTSDESDKENLNKLLNTLYTLIKTNLSKTHLELFSLYTKDKSRDNIANLKDLSTTTKTQEDNLLNELNGDRFKILKLICQNTQNAYLKFITDTIIIFEEEFEFQRFNKLFLESTTLDILNSNSYVAFTPAELKALCCQETADFCNINVYGIHNKQKGYKQNGRKNQNFHGICQIGEKAIIDSLQYLKTKKINVLEGYNSKNKNIEPQHAIWLSAAYLGCITERYLLKLLPSPIPKCNEFKKLVLASYNSNFNNTERYCKNYVSSNKKKTYTFDLIKDKYNEETRKYVKEIIERLN